LYNGMPLKRSHNQFQ